jgi:hypothetical protein
VTNGALRINGQTADWLSYVVFSVHRTAARGRALNLRATWEQRLREAEDEARIALQDPLAERDRRQEVWNKCVMLIKEAQVLLRSDPNYQRAEANQIVRTTLLECQQLVAVTPVIARGMGRGRLPGGEPHLAQKVTSHLAMLDIEPGEDLTKSTAAYAEQLQLSQAALASIIRSGAV